MSRLLMLPLLLAACSSPPSEKAGSDSAIEHDSAVDTAEPEPPSPEPPAGRLVIEQVYYSGAAPSEGRDHYFSDQFIQLRNQSESPVEVGGLLIGDAYGLAGAINTGDRPDAEADDSEVVVLSNLWRVPGAPEDLLVEPGGCLLIAQDAGQHTPYSTIDLWDADLETWVEGGDDTDDAVVPNLEPVHFTGGVDWLVTVFGPTIVVLAPTDASLLEVSGRKLRAPSSAVVDSMEALMDADSGEFKRLHADIDAGFVHVSDIYTGEAVRRVHAADGSLQDTDDSTADFEVVSPDPTCTSR
jgi:hypothetical protein